MKFRGYSALATLVSLVCLGPLAAPQTDSGQPNRILAGSIRMSKGELPDQRMRVSLYLSSGALADEIFSDSNGNFEFTRLRAGSYRLAVRLEGYQPVSLDVEILPFTPRTVVPQITLSRSSGGIHDLPATAPVDASEFRIPKPAMEAFEKGQRAAGEDRHSEARKHFTRALELYPNFAQAHYGLGVSLTLMGELTEARKSLERAIELNPRAPESYLALGKVLNLMSEPQRAKSIALKGTELVPSAAAMWVELSRAELALGEYGNAVQHATQAVELDAKAPPEVHLILANAHLKLSRYVDAERELRAYLKVDPGSRSAAKAREVLDQLHRAGVKSSNE